VEVKYADIVSVRRKICKTCFTLIYHFPCEVDANIAGHLSDFGPSKYGDLNKIKLLRISTKDGYNIKSRVGDTSVKFMLPKELQNTDISDNDRKKSFENGLVSWLESKLDIKITF